jgi:nitrile hydratase
LVAGEINKATNNRERSGGAGNGIRFGVRWRTNAGGTRTDQSPESGLGPMTRNPGEHLNISTGVVVARGETPIFGAGDRIRIRTRSPIGHYRVPIYLRGKRGVVERIIEPIAIDNEQEGYGRNAGGRLHYYRVAIPLNEIWLDYIGSPRDGLRIEVYETWLERM